MVVKKKEGFADPTALGLYTFTISTFFLSLHNVGLLQLDAGVIAHSLLFGGIVQFICGLMEFKRKNMFGLVAFSGYGFFWMSFAFIGIFTSTFRFDAPPEIALGFYLLCWALFTLFLTVALFVNKGIPHFIQVIFSLLLLLFVLLSITHFVKFAGATEVAEVLTFLDGIIGITVSVVAGIYACILLFNDSVRKSIQIPETLEIVHLGRNFSTIGKSVKVERTTTFIPPSDSTSNDFMEDNSTSQSELLDLKTTEEEEEESSELKTTDTSNQQTTNSSGEESD